jgi:hypothetical protein
MLPELLLNRIKSIRSMTFEVWAESITTREQFFSLFPLLEEKREIMMSVSDPEPGIAFSYEACREGRNGQVIVGIPKHVEGERLPSQDPDSDDGIYTVGLQEAFQKKAYKLSFAYVRSNSLPGILILQII